MAQLTLPTQFRVQGQMIEPPRRLVKGLQSALDDFIPSLPIVPGECKFELVGREIVVKQGGASSSFPLTSDMNSALRKIEEYGEHMGILKRQIRPTLQKSHKNVQPLKPVPSTYSKSLYVSYVGVEAVAVTQNTLGAFRGNSESTSNKHGLATLGLTLATKTVGAYISGSGLLSACKQLKNAERIEDKEGIRRARTKVTADGAGVASALCFFGAKVSEIGSSHVAQTAATVGLYASSALLGVGLGVAIALPLLGTLRCHNFSTLLKEYKGDGSPERIEAVVRFLRASVAPTANEIRDLEEECGGRGEDFKIKIGLLRERKVLHMKRRSSVKSVELILKESDAILKMLKTPNRRALGLAQANELIKIVEAANFKKKALYITSVAIAILGFVALILASFTGFVILPLILYALCNAITLITLIAGREAVFQDANVADPMPLEIVN